MSLVIADRVLETASSPGTGTVTLLGAVTGYQSFASAIGNTNTTYYTIADQSGSNWECGLGTVTTGSPNTLARTTVLASSNSGSLVNFASGTQNVFVTYPAEKSVYLNASGNVSALGTVSSGTWNASTITVPYGGTGQTTFTSGQVLYGNGTSGLSTSSNMTFNGTSLTLANDASIHGLTVGLGAGSQITNTVVGSGALAANTSTNNTAIGYNALAANTSGQFNTAVGQGAASANTTGVQNSIFGDNAFVTNTTGSYNSAFGRGALNANTSGGNNTAIGQFALVSNTTASNNTAVGYQAGYSNAVSSYNTFIGINAGYSYNGASANTFNTFVGAGAGYYVSTGTNNTILGAYAGNNYGLDIRTASNYIVLSDGSGNPRAYSDGNGSWTMSATNNQTLELNNSYASGICLSTLASNTSFTGNVLDIECSRNTSNGSYSLIAAARAGVAYVFRVYDSGNVVNTNNSYGSISDIKLKENIVDATPKLADLMKVQVRHYNLKNDPNKLKQIGVVAQEVEQIFAGVVEETPDRDAEGKDLGTTTKSVKYSVFVPMLIKAIQEQQALITDLQTKLKAAGIAGF